MTILLSLLAGLCVFATLTGLVTGEGLLRVGGLAGVGFCLACACAVEYWYARKAKRLARAERPSDPFDEIQHLDWTPRSEDRAA